MKKNVFITIVIILISIQSFSQKANLKRDTTSRFKYTISSSYMSFTNFDPDAVTMYEFYFGYRITAKNTIAIKAVTWKLNAPLGIPWGPSLMNKSEYYPGRLRESGIGISYQRFLWKGLYASIQILPLVKTYLDEKNKKIGDGFRLYTTYHLGYYIPLFKNRLYIEPQIHCNYWPVNTKGPQGFEEKENKWNNYFLFEPNLNIGVNF